MALVFRFVLPLYKSYPVTPILSELLVHESDTEVDVFQVVLKVGAVGACMS
jgi:hypothetical protein